MDTFQTIIDRQYPISHGEYADLDLPRFRKYAVCNLRGGIGKTTLVFNLSYLTDDLLAVDTCPQCNLSYFFDNHYLAAHSLSVHGLILPYIIPSIGGRATHAACKIHVTNHFFDKKTSCFIKSKNDLYLLPSQLTTAIHQAWGLDAISRERTVASILFSSITVFVKYSAAFFACATNMASPFAQDIPKSSACIKSSVRAGL